MDTACDGQAVNLVASQPEGRGFVSSHCRSTFSLGTSLSTAAPFPEMMHIVVSLIKGVKRLDTKPQAV